MKVKSPKKFFNNEEGVSTDSENLNRALAKNYIKEGSLRFWNLVAMIVERDLK